MSDDPNAPDAAKDAAAALAWIRGFKRGVTNDPPDNCPDLPFDGENSGTYSFGMRVGAKIRAKTGIDDSSTLIVTGYPDGTEVIGVPGDVQNPDLSQFIPFGVTPLRCSIGSGNWRIYIRTNPLPPPDACQFILIGVEPSSQTTIDNGTISGLYGVGPFRETP